LSLRCSGEKKKTRMGLHVTPPRQKHDGKGKGAVGEVEREQDPGLRPQARRGNRTGHRQMTVHQ